MTAKQELTEIAIKSAIIGGMVYGLLYCVGVV